MLFEIARVPASMDPAEFERLFYGPRVPVIVEGVTRAWMETQDWSYESLLARIESSASAERMGAWWNLSTHLLADEAPMPALLEALRGKLYLSERDLPVRLWVTKRGVVTGWHYDGNSIDGFNVQVCGRKRFTMLSPETPLPCFSLAHYARHTYAGPKALRDRHRYSSFELGPGDMLFLPRYWFHTVESLDPVNINLNWVWTDLDFEDVKSATGIRERESIALGLLLGRIKRWLLTARSGPPRALYGGARSGEIAVDFLRRTPASRLAARALRELLALFPSALAWRQRRRWRFDVYDGRGREPQTYEPEARRRRIMRPEPCPRRPPAPR